MNIKEVLVVLLYAFILMSAVIYSWHKLADKKINFKSHRLYITVFGMMATSIFNFFIINKFVRVILITIILMFFYRLLFKETIHKCVLTPIYSQVLILFSELIFMLIFIPLCSKYDNSIMNELYIEFITNISVSLILITITRFKFVKRIYIKILKLTDKIKTRQLIIFCIFGMLILNIFVMISYYKIKLEYFVLINVSLIVFVLALIIYLFKTQNNYNKVSDNYNMAKNSLKDYEKMMTKYRIANHENKNLLQTVRVMIMNKEENIPEYIDKIIEKKYEDDEKLLLEMSVIPTGGLRATIYSEILKIKENKIKYNLSIDRKISTIDLIEIDTNTTIDICKVIGVFIDNSIEAVKTLKDKNINIELYINGNNLYIKVSNNYKGIIDTSKLTDEGYTTKGKGHGYGLVLVKNIIDNNNLLQNKTEVSKNVFSQTLIIKYKKNH